MTLEQLEGHVLQGELLRQPRAVGVPGPEGLARTGAWHLALTHSCFSIKRISTFRSIYYTSPFIPAEHMVGGRRRRGLRFGKSEFGPQPTSPLCST